MEKVFVVLTAAWAISTKALFPTFHDESSCCVSTQPFGNELLHREGALFSCFAE